VFGYARSGQGRRVLVVVGLDFGTLSSKVALRAPFLPGEPVFIAKRKSFETDPCPDWLWPARLFETTEGRFSLAEATGAREHTGLKQGVMDERPGSDVLVVGYLGAVLRSARAAVLSTEADTFAAFERIDWELNLGIPSPWADGGQLAQKFLRIAKAAWEISREPGISRGVIESALDAASETATHVEVMPEVQVGAREYVASHARQGGLHLFLDVGASTADLAMCRLFRNSDIKATSDDDEERWSMLHVDVQPLGIQKWKSRLLAAVSCVDSKYGARLREEHDLTDPMAEDIAIDWERSEIGNAVDGVEDRFRALFRQMAGGAIQETVTRRDPLASEIAAGGSLPLLLMGGGARSPSYRRMVVDLEKNLKQLGFGGFAKREAPVPKLRGVSEGHGHRLTVALGLSRRAADAGIFRGPEEIQDIPPRREQARSDLVDKSMV